MSTPAKERSGETPEQGGSGGSSEATPMDHAMVQLLRAHARHLAGKDPDAQLDYCRRIRNLLSDGMAAGLGHGWACGGSGLHGCRVDRAGARGR